MAEQLSVLEEIERMRISSLTPKPEYQKAAKPSEYERLLTHVGGPKDDTPERVTVRFVI